ncbi:MAG: NHL repeat-containing protein [Solirubrobacterales bacterium]
MLDSPQGIATDPISHRVYIAETNNRRVSVFSAWGEFVMAFGWGVRDGASEPQTCTTATGCQKGLTGGGKGQFGEVPSKSTYKGPTGIAVDSTGNVYVMDLGNFRVQKFDSEGHFLLTFGGKVNVTSGANLCTAASGDVCGTGQVGTGPGEFSIENLSGVRGDYLDVAADGSVYVGDKDRIQVFNPDGSYKASLPLPEPGNPGALAVDPLSGNLYFAFSQELGNGASSQPGIYKLSPTDGKQIGTPLGVEKTFGLAVDPGGNVYAASKPAGKRARVVKLDPAGNEVVQFAEQGSEFGWEMPAIATGKVGPGAGDVDIYVADQLFGANSSVKIYGATPDPTVVGPPPKVAPQITEQFATSVDSDGAVLKARINPLFWTDTTYYLEYGTGSCATGPCASAPLPPGSKLTTRSTNEALTSAGVFLGALTPNTTYHYRFVAQSGGSEGQPVRGVGGKVGQDGAEGTFTTRPTSEAIAPCANEGFRLDAAASLPDCRAYEMVSPVDKNNSDIITLVNYVELPARANRSASDGERLTYSAYKAFGEGAIASPYSSQYLAERVEGKGWAGRSISPPRQGPTLSGNSALDVQFKEFSSDLCSGWFLQDTDLSLATEAVPGFPNLYETDLCGGGYEAITQVPPPERAPNQYSFEVQGRSVDGVHTVFRANDKLTPNAPGGDATTQKVYDYFEGNLRLVCVLPNKTAVAGCSVGTAADAVTSANVGRIPLHNAVSADGLRIYWTAASSGPGKLYLRSNTVETIAVSKGPAEFLGAAADGSRALYREAGQLFEFEVEEDAPEGGSAIVGGLEGGLGQGGGVVGMSEDATRGYFVSKEDLDGGGGAAAGKPNLYLHEDGSFTFIATLADDDIEAPIRSMSAEPFRHAARVTPDGETVAFISSNELTGQDSTDANSGKADSQVYLWNAGDEQLRCVSCNRTGARPIGADANIHLSQIKATFWAAALLPTTESNLYAPRALTDDGKRIFFESFDKLLARDTNGTLDVYQWEAQGKGSCKDPRGCIELISSGQSPQRSEFVDADAQGEDVFFTTNESLVGWDTGLIDIYDARVDGGLPGPPTQPAACEGEACQGPLSPPNDPTPASAAFQGAGNVKEEGKPRKPRCAKGKARRKGRCVGKKGRNGAKTKKAKKANNHRRASR